MTSYEVDSTYHRCCNAIGGHARTCPNGPVAIFADVQAKIADVETSSAVLS